MIWQTDMDILQQDLSPKRMSHSLGTVAAARQLAIIHGLDVAQAERAALLHDNAKELPLAQMQQIAREKLPALDALTLSSPALLHAPVGAWRAAVHFGVEDRAILQAIRWHTTGKAGMDGLSKVIYLADMIEPNRKPFHGLEKIRQAAQENLNRAMFWALGSSLTLLGEKQALLHPDTQEAYAYFEALMKEENKDGTT